MPGWYRRRTRPDRVPTTCLACGSDDFDPWERLDDGRVLCRECAAWSDIRWNYHREYSGDGSGDGSGDAGTADTG